MLIKVLPFLAIFTFTSTNLYSCDNNICVTPKSNKHSINTQNSPHKENIHINNNIIKNSNRNLLNEYNNNNIYNYNFVTPLNHHNKASNSFIIDISSESETDSNKTYDINNDETSIKKNLLDLFNKCANEEN